MQHSPEAIELTKGSTWDLDRWAENLGWEGAGYVYSHHRDSDSIEESNWLVIREDFINRFGEDKGTILAGDIAVANLGHWAVGWVEHLMYNYARKDITKAAEEIREKLSNYPLLDEDHHSQLVWNNCHPNWTRYCCCSPDESCGCEGNISECNCGRERNQWNNSQRNSVTN